jgi:uncharacterized membrane protein
MDRYVTVGLGVLAGAVLFETALIPGIVIGGGAVLAARYLPRLSRRALPRANRPAKARRRPSAALPARQNEAPSSISLPAGLRIKQAVAKTITFRIIVTGLDFSTNFLVLGELAVAAGLSTFSLVVGPIFYFTHETLWNYLVPGDGDVDLRALWAAADAPSDPRGIVINRPLAKTITFRTFATVMDFTTTYIVVADAATAAALTAFGFALGPFVYLGHEMLWDYYSAPQQRKPSLAVPKHSALLMRRGSNIEPEPA